MKKKFLVAAVAAVSLMTMVACGNNEQNGTTTPAPTVTEAPAATATPAPTEAPKADHQQVMSNMHQAVQEVYGSMYSPSMPMQNDEYYMADMLKLDASWYDAAIVDTNAMSVLPDTFILIHPTEGNKENVLNAMEAYKTTLSENAWYPTTTIRAKGAQAGEIGEYVYFVVLTASVDDMAYEDETAMIEACKESTMVAIQTMAAVVSGELVVEPWTETEKIANAVRKAYGMNYYPNVQVQEDPAYMTDLLKLDAAWVAEAVVEVPMISANADVFMLIKPTEGNLENVKNALDAYKKYLVEESFQYPMNELRVQSAVVETIGEYVCFSILGGAIDNPEEDGISTDEDLLGYYTSQNENAIWAIRGYLNIEE